MEDQHAFWLETGTRKPGGLEVTRRLLRRLRVPQTLLDIGCGVGESCRLACDMGHHVTGVDICPQQVAQARELCPEADIVTAPAEDLPFRDEFFSVVLCECTLHYCNQQEALTEIYRILEPEGLFFLTDLYYQEERKALWAQWEDRGFEVVVFQDERERLEQLFEQALFHGAEWKDLVPERFADQTKILSYYTVILEKK